MSRSTKLISSLATLALVGAGVGAVTTSQASAEAAAKPTTRTLASGLLSPLSLAVSKDGTSYITQNFGGPLLSLKQGQKKPKPVYANKDGFEVGAVSEDDGRLRFALSKNQRRGVIMGIGVKGGVFPVANLGTYEKKNNADGRKSYGFRGLSQDCLSQFSPQGPPPAYKGIVETHPYATLLDGDTTYVADAAANAVFGISGSGKVSTVAVLPATPVKVTGALAEMFGFPECVAGKRYWFEPVPTDVEMGPDGNLYVTSLPGGPEDPSLGANGRVYRVNPGNGKVTKVAEGLLSSTGLAVSRNGDIFVAELFRGRISRIKAGTSTPHLFVKVPLPADVELTADGLFATINALPGENEPPNGQLVRIRR